MRLTLLTHSSLFLSFTCSYAVTLCLTKPSEKGELVAKNVPSPARFGKRVLITVAHMRVVFFHQPLPSAVDQTAINTDHLFGLLIEFSCHLSLCSYFSHSFFEL